MALARSCPNIPGSDRASPGLVRDPVKGVERLRTPLHTPPQRTVDQSPES